MPRWTGVPAALLVLIGVVMAGLVSDGSSSPAATGAVEVLPSPRLDGAMSLEAALAARRSVRSFSGVALTPAEIGQLLWAAQGVTDATGHRTAPSAGALYPLELDVVIAGGIARYLPEGHRLAWRSRDDATAALAYAALGQEAVLDAPLIVVISGVAERTAARYGERAERYLAMEAGHAAQNILLQAVAQGLGAVPVGAFDDDAVRRVLSLAAGEAPLYLIPVGHPG